MFIKPIQTRVLKPPQDDLLAAIQTAAPSLPNKSILAITSKVVSIWQGRCLAKEKFPDKDALIIQEADKYLPRELVPQGRVLLTIKNNLLVPTAGIDEINDYYILWPDEPAKTAQQLYNWVRKTYKIKDFGLIITDSHSVPLRRGTLGLALAHHGFSPVKDYRGTLGLYGRILQVTQANIADGLAAAAVAAMGEGAETTPLALITDLADIQFDDKPIISDKPFSTFQVEEKEDLYYPLLTALPWQEGGHGFICD